MKRYIITGAAGTGKTSLINQLRKKGYYVFNEVSRDIIKEQQQKEGNKTPWEDVNGFVELLFNKTIQTFESTSQSDIVFSDRGLPDAIAYLQFKNQFVPLELTEFNYFDYYHKTVFVLSPWQEIYKNDEQRLLTFSQSVKFHRLLVLAYKSLGFHIIDVPNTTIEERLKFLLSKK